MRVERAFWALVALAIVLLSGGSASAQTAWRESYTAGRPIIVMNTPVLTPGNYLLTADLTSYAPTNFSS